jgi:DNA polymerase-3 subunit gamma/tau
MTLMNEQADHTSVSAGKASADQAYRVLARKYRPSSFDELIGQESLVQTLTNALAMGRLAHAFVLTGLRGIGKTTTARIIARGLNCSGVDGNGGATLTPCGRCSSCTGIAEGRHVDVIEMDAASNTGVDDVREIIDGVGYRPLSARFKIYIIDEVHMLSKNAFNALLKTLEEPPEAVKFIFATTEIRKVPVTVLSRCQRFDLRRVSAAVMAAHLQSICAKENITIEEPALSRLVRAAEGSVRDALSLLDQAAALTADQITDDAVADMLGQAGRGQALDMLTLALAGDSVAAMERLDHATRHGAEPLMVINDMLDLVHSASRLAAGGHLDDAPEAESDTLEKLAETAGVARLARAWQILLKGHSDMGIAPNPHAAGDMVLIRLAHVAIMPTPADLVRKLEKSPPPPPSSGTSAARDSAIGTSVAGDSAASDSASIPPPSVPMPKDIRELVKLCEEHGEMILASTLRMKIRTLCFTDTALTLTADAPTDEAMAGKLSRFLRKVTGRALDISFADSTGGQTLEEIDEDHRQQEVKQASSHPLVTATLQAFPGASVSTIDAIATDEPSLESAPGKARD